MTLAHRQAGSLRPSKLGEYSVFAPSRLRTCPTRTIT